MVLRLRPADATVDRPFSEPNKQNRCGVFEIVSINVYGVYDPMNMRYKRYSPQVLAAMAGTEQLVQRRLGMLYYFRMPLPSHRTISDLPKYQQIAQLVYVHKRWRDDEVRRWRDTSHEDRALMLDAAHWLKKAELVLPIVLTFDGEPLARRNDPQAARMLNVPGQLDGEAGPQVFWSIPDSAYLGYIGDVVPDRNARHEEVAKQYRRASNTRHGARAAVWEVHDATVLQNTEVRDWDEWVTRLHAIYYDIEEKRSKSVVYFETALQWYIDGCEALKAAQEDGGLREESDSDGMDVDAAPAKKPKQGRGLRPRRQGTVFRDDDLAGL